MSIFGGMIKKLRHGKSERLWRKKMEPKARALSLKETYYPEAIRKPIEVREKENIEWLYAHHELNEFYCLYGMDTVDCATENVIDNRTFMIMRNERNAPRTKPYSYIVILRDKLLFYRYLRSVGVSTPDIFAIYKNGVLYDIDLKPLEIHTLDDVTDYYVKDVDGECASFVRHIRDRADFEQTMQDKNRGMYILQRRITQCAELNSLNPNSINTVRLVTVRGSDGEPQVFSSLLRVGTTKSGWVDNWAAGGLCIGINDDGSLKKYGLYKPSFGTKTSVHPDTGIRFVDVVIPQYDKLEKDAIALHRTLYGIHSIGWDIAVTDTGACFIEGNDNWEISLMQASDKGLKSKWFELCQ